MDKLYLLFWGLSSSVFSVVNGADIPVNNTEPALLKYLLQNYSKDARPVLNVNDPVQLKLGIMLRQVIDLNERDQILTINVWIRQYWKDHLLKWNPDDFGGIKSINIAPDRVWKPDVLLYNRASTDLRFGSLNNKIDTNVIVNHDGSTTWLAPAIIKSECKIDVRFFPFDVQSCELTFGSWTHDGLKIDIHLKQESGIDTENFSDNREWFLKGTSGRRDVKMYICCPEPYPTVTYTIILRRRAMFYVFNMVLPTGVIALLSLFSFYLPPNSGERVSFVITVLLAMSVYLIMVTENIPRSTDIPLVSKFFMASMIQIALSLAATCVVIRFDTTKKPMSSVIKLVVNDWLATALLMKKSPRKTRQGGVTKSTSLFKRKSVTPVNEAATDETYDNTDDVIITRLVDSFAKNKDQKNHVPGNAIDPIVKELKVLTSKVHEEEESSKISRDWMFAAEVLDRFFLLLFSFTILITVLSVFVASPEVSLT